MAGRPRRGAVRSSGGMSLPGAQIVRLGPEEAERLAKLRASIKTQRKAADEEFRMELAGRLRTQQVPRTGESRRPPSEEMDKSAAERAEALRKRLREQR